MRSKRKAVTGALMLLVAIALCGTLEARTVTIAVVRDGPSVEDALLPLIEEELGRLTDADLVFKQAPEFDAGWDGARMRSAVENALRDREVDMILGIGALVTQAAAREDLKLTKPFVSSFVQRADIPKLPYSEDEKTLKDNLSLIVIPGRVERDVATLQRMVPFERFHVAVDAAEGEYLEDLDAVLDEYGRKLGFELVMIPVTDDIEQSLAGLGEGVEVAYLTRMPRLSLEKRKALIEGLTALGIPTFSMLGHSDVELGALAALTPDVTRQVVRRVALNMARLIRGVPSDELPVLMMVDTKIWINGQTAAAVGYWPDFEARIYARFLHPEALEEQEEPLTLEQAFALAEKGNVSLSIKDADVESAYRSKKRALSPMLPQIVGDASYQAQEPVVASPLLPENLTTAGIYASQMIFDDRIISDYRSSSRLHESSELDREIERLDVLSEAGQTYLGLALSRVLLKVQADNVRLTEDNLDLSKVRYDVGQAGKDEVFRWESELAQRRAGMLRTNTSVESDRIALNQVLGVDQNARWMVKEYEADYDRIDFAGVPVADAVKTPTTFQRFREIMVEFAQENAAELGFLDKIIEAKEIQVGQRKRRFVLPSFVANFNYDYYLDRTPEIDGGRDDTYRVEVAAVYPLFNGTDRYQDLKLQQSELEGLKGERELARQRVEQRTRTALRRIEGSFPSIGLSVTAAENSKLNLEVVQDKYAQGIVNITELLDAQNQNFTADQNEVGAIYAFLGDLVVLQRSVSWFQFEHSEEEREEVRSRIREAIGLE